MTFTYPAVITPMENGKVHASVPDLVGCTAEGNDLFDALEAVRVEAYEWIRIEMSEFDGDIPFSSAPEDLELQEGQSVRMIMVNVKLLPDND